MAQDNNTHPYGYRGNNQRIEDDIKLKGLRPIEEILGDIDKETNGVPVEFLTGVSGVGKTFEVRRRMSLDPSYALLCAQTGIAACNLGTTTIHSALGFYDLDSLQDSYRLGRLHRRLREIAKSKVRFIVWDEISMSPAMQLDIIHQALEDIAPSYKEMERERPLGLICVGDFAQLPPVPDKDAKGKPLPVEFAFEAECWPKFDANTTIMRKVWRQNNPLFLDGLNAIRCGEGVRGAALLKQSGVEYASYADVDFPGTTLVGTNEEVKRVNKIAMMKVKAEPLFVRSRRWSKLLKRDNSPAFPGDWKNIDETLELKLGAYVMILSNDAPSFSFCNGDCGYVVGFDYKIGVEPKEVSGIRVKLVRNGEEVFIQKITRTHSLRENPEGKKVGEIKSWSRKRNGPAPHWNEIYYDSDEHKFVVGAIEYLPLRAAWATTIHKSQSLSLDRVQVDCRHHFTGHPSMLYVAFSRCRTPEGLRIVGDKNLVSKRTKIDERIRRWL